MPAESKVKGVSKDEIEEATKWVGGLDRIHQARGLLACYDFSATPFAPSGKKSSEEARVLPIWELGVLHASGPRVAVSGLGLIPLFLFSGPLKEVQVQS